MPCRALKPSSGTLEGRSTSASVVFAAPKQNGVPAQLGSALLEAGQGLLYYDY